MSRDVKIYITYFFKEILLKTEDQLFKIYQPSYSVLR